MAAKVNPRSIVNEGPFIPSDPVAAQRMAKLLTALEDAGHSWRTVAGVKAWLEAKAAGRPDPTTGNTRTRYRRLIREVGIDPGPFKGRRSNGVDTVELALVRATGAPRSRARAAARDAIQALAADDGTRRSRLPQPPIMYPSTVMSSQEGSAAA